eukprot:scaffold18052_cov175-Amphora_coffeaeformis.AAC.12
MTMNGALPFVPTEILARASRVRALLVDHTKGVGAVTCDVLMRQAIDEGDPECANTKNNLGNASNRKKNGASDVGVGWWQLGVELGVPTAPTSSFNVIVTSLCYILLPPKTHLLPWSGATRDHPRGREKGKKESRWQGRRINVPRQSTFHPIVDVPINTIMTPRLKYVARA